MHALAKPNAKDPAPDIASVFYWHNLDETAVQDWNIDRSTAPVPSSNFAMVGYISRMESIRRSAHATPAVMAAETMVNKML